MGNTLWTDATRRVRAGIFRTYYVATGRGKVLRDVAELEAVFKSSREELERLNRRRLAAILRHAASTVPFYRARVTPEEITEESVLQVLGRLPILTKPMIRQEGAALHSSLPGERPRWNTSGGSTGEPIKLLQDRAMGQESRTGELLYLRWAGHRWGEPHLLLWGVPQATFSERISAHERLFRFVCRETYLNCYGITDRLLDEWVREINRIRPTVIEAYVDAIREISRRILETGAKVVPPRGIITSAGVLTPTARELITKAFGVPILNRYGSREVGNVACSCGQGEGLHVNEGWCRLEIVDDAGRPCPIGIEGNVLVTVFTNRTMPLIRYRIEDRATWGDNTCACGRVTRQLAAVNGRMNDYLVAADGTRISGVALTTLLYGTEGIRQYQYRQTEPGQVTLVVVPTKREDGDVVLKGLQGPAHKLEHLLAGGTVHLKIEDEIPPSNSGKYRYILNEIGGPRR